MAVPDSGLQDRAQHLMTLRFALRLPQVQRAAPEVVTGDDQLDRPIRWVHAGEARRLPALLKGGELVLTTGMGFVDDPSAQRSFVQELAELDGAALAVELGNAIPVLPATLVATARQANLPLIALHRETPFVEMTEAILQEIVNRRYDLMQRADALRRRLTASMLRGADVPELLSALAAAIENPVLLENDRYGILFHASHRTADSIVFSAREASRNEYALAPPSLAAAFAMDADGTTGRVVALAQETPLTHFTRLALEEAAGLIALALRGSLQEETLAARQRGDLLAALLEEDLDETEIAVRAEGIGFGPYPHMLAFAVAPAVERSRHADADAWAHLWRDLRSEFRSRRLPALPGTPRLERMLLVVVGASGPHLRTELGDTVTALIRTVAKRHLGADDAVVVSVGRSAKTWSGVRASLMEALEALDGSPAKGRLWVDATDPGLDWLLRHLQGSTHLRTFVEARLSPLLEHDASRRSKLLPTLAAYCAHGGAKAETARALHLKRQSLYHRIARIQTLLSENLSDPETLLELHLAIRAHEVLQMQTEGERRLAGSLDAAT